MTNKSVQKNYYYFYLMVSLNPAQIAFTNSIMIYEASKLDHACELAHNLYVQNLVPRQFQDFWSPAPMLDRVIFVSLVCL
jgi:hypothetical protein